MDLLATHRALLGEWRDAMNLVGPGDLTEHYDDCTRALRWLTGGVASRAEPLPQAPMGRWADLGSGAGFPGIVFAALAPAGVSVDLVESRQKRAAFLREVLGRAKVPADRAQVLRERVEALDPESYQGVLARAFAPTPVVLDHAARLLVPEGTLVLFQQDGEPRIDDPRFEVFHVERYVVGGRPRKAVALRKR